uniref:Major capsid protein N-terminal domain-containing protein n=1 Tax=viral metagenome TaxID=1070528 RepID=A0A6C0B4I9_9ZZZZ
MGGGLMQLVAYGAQDIYLTGNPQITFFKVVYRRHTNFAVESIEQTINGSVGSGSKVSVTVARNGDLLSRVYVEVKHDAAARNGAADEYDGFDLIDYVEVEVGGQIIDKHYGAWMKIWCDLTHATDKKSILSKMLVNEKGCGCGAEGGPVSIIPLQFWFCRNPGLALPLIALQYHEVKLNIKFCGSATATKGVISGAEVWCDYIFLDTDERRRFAQVSHEYLIEQVQHSSVNVNSIAVDGSDSARMELRFNHPVKELVWRHTEGTDCCGIDTGGVSSLCDALLQLNGHDRFRKRPSHYFESTQRYEHHTGATTDAKGTSAGVLACYSFALKPEEHQPSGTCNFSRIDNAILEMNLLNKSAAQYDSGKIDVYAVNYNVLRIMSGMGGLAYSN